MPEKSRLMPISYYNPKQEIRLSAYADTIILEPDGQKQHLRAIRFGGYPEMVRAMSDAIYAGATLETEFAGETAMLTCEPKKYECHLSHDGIYAEATILSLDDADTAAKKDEDAQADGQTNVELPPRKCILFCPAGDRQALFEALDRKTAVPLIPEFQDYVLDELQRRRLLKPLRVISIRERLEAWLLLCKKDDANIVKVLEDGLKTGAIRIPGTVQNLNGFDSVHSVTSYLSAFGVTVAERIRNQFQPLFDPAAEQLSPEILRINDHIREHAGYSLYPAQLAVAESVKRKLSEGKSAFIVAECGSGKTKIGATALAAYQAQKRKKTFNIILCPAHVAKKWVRELGETLPETAGVIVRSITELDSLYAQYRQGDKSIYAVISKEKARDGYMRRPAVLFDARKGAFRCPGCGSVIELPSSDDTYDWVTAKPEAFRMENRRNHQCMKCKSPLWTAVNPSVPSPWVKIPEYGWVHRKLAVHAMQKTKNPAALDALQPERLGGFRTVSAKPEADGSRPVYLHPAAAQDLLCGAQNRVGIRRPELGIASFPDAFETAGMDALKGAEDCDLVLMDEIGRMERHADTYSARIRTLLDGCVPILGVVQKKADTPLAAAIRSHPNVRLIEVSEENRDVLLPEILSALRS